MYYYLYYSREDRKYNIGTMYMPFATECDYLLFDSKQACVDYWTKEGLIDGTSCIE